jgi:hypothetical protein
MVKGMMSGIGIEAKAKLEIDIKTEEKLKKKSF